MKSTLILPLFLILTQAAFAVVQPKSVAWMRLNDPVANLRSSPRGNFMAYTDQNGVGLKILNLKTQDIFSVSKNYVGPSYFWSPDGKRLFFREMVSLKDAKVASRIYAYDVAIGKIVSIDQVDGASSPLTYDPRDFRMSYMVDKGIRHYHLDFPGERFAMWQNAAKPGNGKFLVTQKAMLWMLDQGVTISRLSDDQSGIESFALSPDGANAVWATKEGKIFVSINGAKPIFMDHGRDPSWHPTKTEIVYAGARMVGQRPGNYDLKMADLAGHQTYLTSTQYTNERWPTWDENGFHVLYTAERSTDIYRLEFRQ